MAYRPQNSFLTGGKVFGAIIIAILVGALVLYNATLQRPLAQGPAPLDVTGCYSSPEMPDIFLNKSQLVILQEPQISIPYRLGFRKEWGLIIDRRLEPRFPQEGMGNVVQIADHGVFLSLAPEGLDPKLLGFDLEPKGALPGSRYSREGQTCPGR